MALNLEVQHALTTTAQPVKDQKGHASSLTLSTDKVGIGTTVPAAKLHVNGAEEGIRVQGHATGNANVAYVSFVDSAGTRIGYVGDGSTGDVDIFLASDLGDVVLNTAAGRILTATSTGNVGIGTTTPGIANLNVANSGSSVGLYVGTPSITPYGQAMIEINPPSGATHIWAQEGDTRVFSVTSGGEAYFAGNVGIDGDITLTHADCAEDFDVEDAQALEPGTVMVVGDADRLHQSKEAYDKRVAGVLSGAGDYRPGIILGREQSQNNRLPLALTGKVFCKVDAQYSPIGVGDLLTTSPTPGHAMKADDPLKAFGAVIGKALRPLAKGRGLIPILIALQ